MRLVLASFVLALTFGLAGCGGGSEDAGSPPAAPAPEPAPAPAPEPAPEPAPAAEPAATGPGSGSAAAGAPLYATYCASCHGPKGDGDGPASAGLNPKPAHHSDAAYMDTLSDEHIFKVIKQGGASVGKSPLMTAWGGVLTDAQIWDLVAYVRSLER